MEDRLGDVHDDDWDPRDPSVLDDQRAAYDRMREQCPVAHSEFMAWSIFRHADVSAIVADPATYSSASRHPAIPNGMDPPEHGRYREALAPHFSAAPMAELEPRCREIAIELLEPMLAAGQAELLDAFAEPFTLRTLCVFLGWPERLWDCLGGWTHGNQQAAFTRDPAAGRALAKLLGEHVRANLDAHREASHEKADRDPADLTDTLLTTSVDGTPLEDDQIVSVLRNWIAGEGTVAGEVRRKVYPSAGLAEFSLRLPSENSVGRRPHHRPRHALDR
jgi:cytochrome P450